MGIDTALAAANDDRLVGKRGIVALYDRRIEGVAIDMGDRKRLDFRVAQQPRRAATRAPVAIVRHVSAAITAEAGHGVKAQSLCRREMPPRFAGEP